MKRKTVALVVAGVLAFPGLILAQGHQAQEEQAQPGMMGMAQGMMGMMTCPSPSLILKQKEALSLTESQVERLDAIQKEATEAREAHMGQVRPLHMQAMKALEGDKPDFSAYETALRKLADHHVNMQVGMARASQRALEVLSPEQRSNVRYGMRLTREMRGGGMMQGTEMMGGPECPMMGGKGGSG